MLVLPCWLDARLRAEVVLPSLEPVFDQGRRSLRLLCEQRCLTCICGCLKARPGEG